MLSGCYATPLLSLILFTYSVSQSCLKYVSLCSYGWPKSHYADQASFELTEVHLSLPAECWKALRACATHCSGESHLCLLRWAAIFPQLWQGPWVTSCLHSFNADSFPGFLKILLCPKNSHTPKECTLYFSLHVYQRYLPSL